MKKVLTYGTFDLFHRGHLNLLRRAKNFGDYLIVGVSTDEFNRIKGKKTLISFEERMEIVKSIRYVDEVIPEESWEQKERDIKKFDIETFVMGSDWKGEFDYLNKFCEVVYLPRTKHISTNKIKDKLKSFYNIDVNQLKDSIETINAIVKALD
jgi:glycerol-3-phosphate cytidylyltransferase